MRATPSRQLLNKVLNKVCSKALHAKKRFNDKEFTTFSLSYIDPPPCNVFCSPNISSLRHPDSARYVKQLSDRYIGHYFDLLGSGWVQIKHGMSCRGLEGNRYDSGVSVAADRSGEWLSNRINKANLRESQRIWSMVDEHYTPIDWHLDFKSGYRWPENVWYRDVEYGENPGVDVKVPWELARMQHLPQLAWAYALADAGTEGFLPAEIYLREFRNQILDFIATNPPRFGVNWSCTMDVGIRIANWLVTYELFRGMGACFDPEFEAVFSRSVYEHGKHCIENLEYYPELRSNHYLSDIAGLLFSAFYLPSTPESDRWLAFALQELVSEMENEFHPDGSNFEASTSYHRLSTEIMLYCAALCLRLTPDRRKKLMEVDSASHNITPPLRSYDEQLYRFDTREIFPSWFWDRIERAAEFTVDITAPNGEIPQFGDNDSGRFLKLWPEFRVLTVKEAVERYGNLAGYSAPPDSIYPDEVILDHGHITDVAGVVFGKEHLNQNRIETPETALIRSWLAGVAICSFRTGQESPLSGAPQLVAYRDFGLYILKTQRIYLAIRCGSIGQAGFGGHAHNDQLSFELHLDGEPIIVDPGTFLYTPAVDQRNLFRSTERHSTVALPGVEQHRWGYGQRGLFFLIDKSAAVCETWENRGNRVRFRGRLRGYGGRSIEHVRDIHVDLDQGILEIQDTLLGSETAGIVSFITPQSVNGGGAGMQLGSVLLESSSGAYEICTATSSPKYGTITPVCRVFTRFHGSHTAKISMISDVVQGDC